jgi:nitrogen regulatory protein PII 1
MKMIKAIIRPEKEEAVVHRLEQENFAALTKWDVLGRGRQGGIQVGGSVYGELAKLCIMLVVADEEVPKALHAIMEAAHTGHPGDGRIFVSEVEEAYRIRTGHRSEPAARTPDVQHGGQARP